MNAHAFDMNLCLTLRTAFYRSKLIYLMGWLGPCHLLDVEAAAVLEQTDQ